MKEKNSISPLVTLLIVVTCTLIMLLAIRATREIISPIILALLLAITASPLVDWFKRKGIPNTISVWLVILIISIIVVGFVALVSYSVVGFADTLTAYSNRFVQLGASADLFLSRVGLSLEALVTNNTYFTPEGLVALFVTFLREFFDRASNWVLVLVITIVWIRETAYMPQKVRNIADERNPDIQRFIHFNREVRHYMSITAGLGFVASVFEVILLLLLGIESAILWGTFAFFMSFVPQIGIYIAIIPPAILALVQFGAIESLSVVIGYLLIDGIINRSIKRQYFQRKLNVSMPVIFISLVLWIWVLGSIGAILAVPMAMLVQALLASRKDTLWIAYLMGGGQNLFEPDVVTDAVEREDEEK